LIGEAECRLTNALPSDVVDNVVEAVDVRSRLECTNAIPFDIGSQAGLLDGFE
jgi:hypothetical protein